MKFSYVGIVAVMCIVIAVAVAGCTSQSTMTSGASQGSSASSSGSSASAAATSTPQVGSTVSSTSVFANSGYSHMEYQITSNSGGKETTGDMKYVLSSGTYQGQPAMHTQVTMTMSTGTTEMNGVYDYYYDTTMNTLLGGTITSTVNGKTMTMAMPTAQLQQAGATNFHSSSPLTFAGVEPITVPAGTYPAASKYTKSENGDTVTYWSAPGIPVPVQITSSSSYGSSTSQLVSWG